MRRWTLREGKWARTDGVTFRLDRDDRLDKDRQEVPLWRVEVPQSYWVRKLPPTYGSGEILRSDFFLDGGKSPRQVMAFVDEHMPLPEWQLVAPQAILDLWNAEK